jgi:predicted helicase
MPYARIEPDKNGNWVNQTENDWDDLIPVASKETKQTKWPSREGAIFKLFSLGVVTARDEWVYDRNSAQSVLKVRHLVDAYESHRVAGSQASAENNPQDMKWSRAIKRDLGLDRSLSASEGTLVSAAYRPFDTQWLFYSARINEMLNQTRTLFGSGGDKLNVGYVATDASSQKPFMVLATDHIFDYHLVGAAAAASGFFRYRYTSSGERIDNITSWAENKFRAQYGKAVSKDDIFHYVYAVLHDPVYREKYAINLKREFPRIPFYPDFRRWVAWGGKLMALHIGYETVEPWPLKRLDTPDEKARAAGVAPKALLKADKDNGIIRLDTETQLSGIPPEVWDYRLGNRSGVEWILDQYKEKTPKDPTIREKFNTYRFADYKEKVIDLIARVTRVSVETVAITEAMKAARRD